MEPDAGMKTSLIQSNALKIPIADKKVHCVITSPPYYGLRDYGTAEWIGGDENCSHNPQRPDGGERADRSLPLGRGGMYKDGCKCGAKRLDAQLGLESTLQEYIDNTVLWAREVWRVLRDDGTFWLNLGDSYAGSGKGGNQEPFNNPHSKAIKSGELYGFKPKDLMLVPHRVAIALQNDGWWVRSDIVWAKPNPMPESVKDRPTKSHEYIFLLTKSKNYYYDQDAIRKPHAPASLPRALRGLSVENKWNKGAPGSTAHTMSQPRKNRRKEWEEKHGGGGSGFDGHSGYYDEHGRLLVNPAGRNKRSVWTMTTKPYKDAHFATFPPELPETCIKAGTSEKGVCPVCGNQWVREVETEGKGKWTWHEHAADLKKGMRQTKDGKPSGTLIRENYAQLKRKFKGWKPTCSHNEESIPATVLDLFGGSGTTAMVAKQLGRIGICMDLSWEYLQLAEKRCGKVEYQYSFIQ